MAIEEWRVQNDPMRPHSALSYFPPASKASLVLVGSGLHWDWRTFSVARSTCNGFLLLAGAVTLQDFAFRDWEGRVPALKLLHGIGQGELDRQGLDGTSDNVGNSECPYGRISGRRRCEPSVGALGEQRMLQVSLQRSKRARKESGPLPPQASE